MSDGGDLVKEELASEVEEVECEPYPGEEDRPRKAQTFVLLSHAALLRQDRLSTICTCLDLTVCGDIDAATCCDNGGD